MQVFEMILCPFKVLKSDEKNIATDVDITQRYSTF